MVQIILWNGGRNPNEDGFRNGDIVELLENGRHPGRKIVDGAAWDGPVSDPFMIIDITAPSVEEAKRRCARHLTAASTLRTLDRTFRAPAGSFPQAIRRQLRDATLHRVTLPGWPVFLATLAFKEGMTELRLMNRETRNGRLLENWVLKP